MQLKKGGKEEKPHSLVSTEEGKSQQRLQSSRPMRRGTTLGEAVIFRSSASSTCITPVLDLQLPVQVSPKPYAQCWAAGHPSPTLGSSFLGSPSADFMTHALTTDVSCPTRAATVPPTSPGGALSPTPCSALFSSCASINVTPIPDALMGAGL